MSKAYQPSDWYWLADDGRLFSSAAGKIVTDKDKAFAAWSESGAHPTPWPKDDAGAQTDAALNDVLAPYGLSVAAVIADITSAQGKIQLRRAGLRDKVDALIAAGDGELQDWWSDARTWQRTNPNILAMAKALKLKDADVDQMFRDAAKIAA